MTDTRTMSRYNLKILILLCAIVAVSCEETTESVETTDATNEPPPQDLYVIKTIVYEVGILTDATNDTDQNETLNQIDVTYFDPNSTGPLDLSNIPIPIQTNVSGVSITGVIPLSTLALNLNAPQVVLPTKQVTVTQNLSTNDPEKGEQIISNLPAILGLGNKNHKNSTTEKSTDKDD